MIPTIANIPYTPYTNHTDDALIHVGTNDTKWCESRRYC